MAGGNSTSLCKQGLRAIELLFKFGTLITVCTVPMLLNQPAEVRSGYVVMSKYNL